MIYLYRINDYALAHGICYSCQVLLLFLPLRCSISVRFAFRSGIQETVSSLETSASLELTEKQRKAIVKVYTTFALLSQWFFFSCLVFLICSKSQQYHCCGPLSPTTDRYVLIPHSHLHGLVEGVPDPGREAGTRWYLRSLQNQTILLFCFSQYP